MGLTPSHMKKPKDSFILTLDDTEYGEMEFEIPEEQLYTLYITIHNHLQGGDNKELLN